MIYRLLCNADFDPLHECFLAAFSDYEVDMRLSREQFEQRLTRDGIALEMSAGAFDDERMIGFCLNAVGEWLGKTTAYDGGTGIVPGYRGRGIGKELFTFVEGELKRGGRCSILARGSDVERSGGDALSQTWVCRIEAACCFQKVRSTD